MTLHPYPTSLDAGQTAARLPYPLLVTELIRLLKDESVPVSYTHLTLPTNREV